MVSAEQSEVAATMDGGNTISTMDPVHCRIDAGRTVSIQYSPFLQTYTEVTEPFFLDETSLSSTIFMIDDDEYINQNPIINVKICWCSQYFDRPLEFCPADYDSCRVDGNDGPATCYQDNNRGSASFVRIFWLVCLFWFLALAYTFTCSDQGTSAQAFLRRKLCLRCCTRNRTEEEMLLNDIETMIEQDPNRATWLLRSAFLREHRRIERNAQRRGQQDRPAGDGPDSNNNPDYLDDSIIQTGRKVKCEVKVKRYTGYERKDTVETDRITTLEGSQSSADELEDQAQGDEGCSSCSTDDHVNNNDGDNKSLATFSLISAQQLFSSAVSMLGEGATKDDDNGEDGVQCAICLFDINVGDRIADLECKHMFCIECLKDWLKRKNHCPLCQLGGIAKPIVEDSAGENIRDVEAQQETAQEGRGPSSSAGDNTAESRPGSGRGGLIASNFLPSRAR